jgi:hypothetical protein
VVICLLGLVSTDSQAGDCNCSYISVFTPGYSIDVVFATDYGDAKVSIYQLAGGETIATCICIEGKYNDDCRELWEHGTGGVIYENDDDALCMWEQPAVGQWECNNIACYEE